MRRFADLPIRRKFTLVILAASGVAMLISGVALLLVDRATFQETLVRRLRGEAEIVAANSAAAIVFRDPDSARETIASLRSEEEIEQAALYGADGRLVASFTRGAAAVPPPAILTERSAEPAQRLGNDLLLAQPVELAGSRVGTLVIRSGLHERQARLARYAAIVGAVSLTALLVAALVGWLGQRTVSEPILELAATSRRMSADGDLSVRARARGADEVGTLVAAFNGMLERLQHRDADLRRTQSELERRAEEASALYRTAEQANRLKDEFLATLSHELRTPLNAIVGWAHLLRRGLDPQMTRKAAETISRNAMTQTQLIGDILDMQRISSGKLRLDLRTQELPPIVEAAVDTVRPAAQAKSIEIVTQFDISAGAVLADADRLQQVVWNLLSNAVKFTPEHGHVSVAVSRAGPGVSIVVEDDGPGLDPEFLPYAFDRFRQGDSSSTRRHGGLGLGLAIVKNLAELHGGKVTAANRRDRTGAVFTVTLPGAAEGQAVRRQPAVGTRGSSVERTVELAAAPALHGIDVLVVDDEPDARELVAAVLEQCGADVTTVSSAAEAFAQLRLRRPDVLLSDVEMPGEDGLSLLRRIRQLPPEAGGTTPAAALTAYAATQDRIRVLAAGYQLHVPKPVQPAELAAVVASLAGRAGSDGDDHGGTP